MLVIIMIAANYQNLTFGQNNFKSAILILNNGDSLAGEIDYRNWKQSPAKITFRKDAVSQSETYSPTEVSSFRVSDEIYYGATALVDKCSDIDGELHLSRDIITASRAIFLTTAISGNKSLYYYDDGIVHFYIRKNENFELLRYKKYIRRGDSKEFIETNNDYMAQLSAYLSDCLSINSKIEKTTYDLPSLNKVFLAYYACSASSTAYSLPKQKTALEFGLLAGISNSTLRMVNEPASEGKFKGSTNFSGGLFFDIILPRNLKKISINNELSYTSYSAESYTEQITNQNSYVTTSRKLAFAYIKMNNMARYRFLLKNANLFLNTGLTTGLAISNTNQKEIFTKSYSSEQTKRSAVISSPRTYEQGYLLGIGGKMKRLSIEARMEKSNGMSPSVRLKTAVTRYFALLGYQIK